MSLCIETNKKCFFFALLIIYHSRVLVVPKNIFIMYDYLIINPTQEIWEYLEVILRVLGLIFRPTKQTYLQFLDDW